MTYIIAEPCVDVTDRACVDVCPVDCIYENKPDALSHPITKDGKAVAADEAEEDNLMVTLLIHPEECIDCGACEPECPVEAIFAENEVPDQWAEYTRMNYEAFGFTAP